jgi:hypothetical protein
MKTQLFIPVLLFVFLAANAGNKNDFKSFVVANDDTILCKDLAFNASNATLTMENGQTMEIKRENVDAFKSNGKVYVKNVVYKNRVATEKTAYMLLLGERNGLKLYRYKFYELDNAEKLGNSNPTPREVVQILVYKDNSLYLQVEDKNVNTVIKYFNAAEIN